MELNEWVDKYVRGDKAEELNKWDIQIAINKGYQDGIEQDRIDGRAEGLAEASKEIAKEMIKLNMPIEDISKITKLDIKTIEELKKQ